MAENNVKKMYEYFSTHKNNKGNAFFGGTYDEFRESLADNNVRLNMYNHLSQANIFKGSIDEFDNELGFAQPHQIEQVQPQQAEQPQLQYIGNQEKGFGQRAKDAIWGGTLKLGAGIIDAMSRFGAAQAQADAYKYGGLENQERVNEQVSQARESLNKGEGLGQKYLGTKADAISEENQQRYGYNEDGSAKGATDLIFRDKKILLGLEKAFMDGLASAPTTVVALTGPAGLVALGAGSAEQKYEQLKAEQPDMSEGAMITNAVLTGAFESATEYIGKLPILRNWKLFKDPTTEEVLREQIERLGQSWVKKYVGGTLKSLSIQMGQEALEEATNAIAGMALDKVTGVERGYSIDEVIDAAMAGAMGGATGGSALSGAGMGVGAYRQRKGRKAMVEYNEAYNASLEQMGGQYNQWEASLDESVDRTALRQTLGNLATQYANGSLSRADLRAELINMGVKPSQMPTDNELLGLLAIEQNEADGDTGWFAGGRKSKELKLSAYINGYYGAGAQEEILGFMRQNNLSQEQFVDLMTNNKPTAEQVGLRNKFYESMEGHREAQQLRYKFLNKFCEENGVTEDQLDMMLQRRAQGIELKDWELELSNRFDEAMSNYEHENKIKATIDGKAQIAVDLIRRQTNNSNGRLQNVRVGNEETPSVIKQGNVSILMNKEGKLYIDEQNSDDVVVVTDTNGENARQIGIKELTPLFDGLAKEVQGMAVESIERNIRNTDTFTQGTMIALPNGQAGIVQSVGEDGSIAMLDFQGNPITIAPQDTENARKVTFTEGMNVGGVTIEGVQEDGNLIVNGEVINPSAFASGMQQYLYDSAEQTPKAPIVTPQQAQEVQTNAVSAQLQQDIADAKELGDDFVDTMLTQAQKALDKASKQKPTGTDANTYRASKNKIDAQVAQAQAEVDRWLAVQQALAQEQIQNTINNEQNESPKVENANQVGNVARDKFVNSKRFEGNTSVRTLPNGTQIKGRYMLVSAESLTPSHNPLDNWNTSEGFPLNERGQNINDRDYKNDVSAQNETIRIAQQYGGQAVEQVPTVSPEGVVYDGNGRTMAGIIAAQNGTDASYIETLKANASNFGFTPQQVNEIPSARVVFVTDEVLPYTTQTFAQFNQQEKKTQSSTENAVAKSKSLDAQTISQLLSVVDSFATLDSFFTSPIACADMLKVLQEKGIIAPTEVAGLTETNKNGELVFNAHGRAFITDVLIGANFTENVIRQMAGDKGLKQSVLRALNVIIANRKLGEFALTKHINNAISLIREANNAKLSVSLYLRQTNMFEALATERYTAFEILIAEQLQSGVENFRELLSKYNNYARENQGGQIDMFAEGGLLSIEDITNIILEQYGHRTTQTEHAIQSSSRGENRANEEGIRERRQGDFETSRQQPNDITRLEENLGKFNKENAPKWAKALFDVYKWNTLEEADATLGELLKAFGEKLDGQTTGILPFLDEAQKLITQKLLHLKEGESVKDFFERLKKTKQPILNRIQEWQNKVGVPVEVIISPLTIKNKIAYNEIAKGTNVKGWYDPNTGKAYIYLPNAESVKDVDETVMHEIIAHKGLRELLGKEKFDELCDAVWDMMSEKQRAEKLAYLNSTGAHRNATQQERQRAAADEYIAFLAENVQLKEDLTVWESVVRKIKDILKSLGIKFRMSDEQLGELLRESARMFRDNARNASQNNMGTSEDVSGTPMFRTKLSQQEADEFVSEMEQMSDIAPEIELTIENWDKLFGEESKITTPIGEVKMGENQFAKLMRQGRDGKLGMIKPTLESPHAIVEIESEANQKDLTERPSTYVFVRSFKKSDGSRYYYFTSITVKKDSKEVVVSNQEKSRNRIMRLLQEGNMVWRTPKDATTFSAERQGLDYEQSNKAETESKGSEMTPQTNPSADKVTNNIPNTQEIDEENVKFRIVSEEHIKDKLGVDKLETEKVYRAMQMVDGKLYPPMAGKVNGEWQDEIKLGEWEEAIERPDMVDEKGNFKLDKGNKKSLKARYNPYFHTSRIPLNDQFAEAQSRPNLVTVEVEVPKAELTSGYKAEKAKDAVGLVEWKAGVIQGKLSGKREVILSRWNKPIRVVPDSEVAQRVVEMFGGKEITMPSNVVTPSLRAELEKLGVPFVETDNQGKPVSTEVNFRITYHGSGEKFDKFDRFAQRSGLITNKLGIKGIYVSDSEEVGTNYALTNRYRGEGKSHLYKVEIPDDRGWNYIHWESKAWKSFLRDVNKVLEWYGYRAIDKSEVHSNYRPNDKGVVFEVLRRKLGYDKDLLTNFLRKMGIVGISYPSYYEDKNVDKNARSYVIFDENDLEIKDVVSFRITPAEDKAYMDAVERGDMKTAQKMVDDAAEKTGYNSDTAYQGSLAFNGSAPSSNAYFETKEARKEAWQNGEYEGTMSLGDFVDSGIDTNDLEWQLNDPRATMNEELFTIESIRNLRNTVRSGKRTIKMYRAVDANIKENSFRNGDWITPSRRYAKEHVTLQDWKRSRIIEQEVSIDDIWWNGDDINEWGYDDGKDYGYQNTKNNRKLLDAVTYDDNGNVIPLSKRFNKRNEDVRFRFTPEMIDANNQFNEELQQQIDGTLPKGHIYQIGMPSNILRSAGVVDLPIELSAERLYAKSMQENHPFSLESVSNLPMAIQNPIAVFDSRTNKKSKVILTELQYDGNNFVIALRLRNEGEGIDLEVNSIQSLYPKDRIGGVIEWVNSGLLRYANKNKLVDFLTQSTNLIAGKETDLNDATKLIQNFENPKLLEENFENNDIRFRVGTQIIETDNKTLVGLHNISESKFKEAMKRGGLANPSFAIIDTEKQSFDDFGEISLIMPSSLVDPKGNSGVYTGDIWSPTYPRIRKQIDKKGWKKIDDTIDALIEDKDIARGTKKSLFDYIEDGRSANAEYAFLVSKGITPKIVRKTNEGIVSTKELKNILGASEDLNIGWDIYEAYKNLPEEKKEEINLWRHAKGDRQRKDDLVKRLNSEPKTEFAKAAKMSAEFAIKRELSFAEFDTFIYDVVSKEKQNGTVDVRLTQSEARQYCYENNLDEEYRSWLNNLIDSVNPKEVFFTGYDYEGNPKYAKATLENISRHMKKEGIKNAYNNTGFDATRALLLKKLATLKEIQSNKDLLKTSDAVAEEIEVLNDKLYDIISRLSDMEQISDNQFINIDYANARLQEAIVKRNPIQYLNSEYGYDIEKDGEFAKDLSAFIEEVKLLPAKYFEGKFTRPVYLSEFSAAVVPNTISPSTTSYFVEANVPIYIYNPSVEGSRQEATMEAINNEGVRFRITPESTPIFESNALVATQKIKQEKATPQQWLAMIEKNAGIKAGEDKWLGLSDWLKSSTAKTLTKDEVLEYIKENMIDVQEVWYGEMGAINKGDENTRLANEIIPNFSEAFELHTQPDGFWFIDIVDYEKAADVYNEMFDGNIKAEDGDFENMGDYNVVYNAIEEELLSNPKFKKAVTIKKINYTRLEYTTEGLDNKKEVALVVPTIDSWNQFDAIHFGDAGDGRAVAWVRFGETYDADGNSVLVIDEIQSKRHQAGRDVGYTDLKSYEKEKAILDEKASELFQRRNKLIGTLTEKYGDFTNYTKKVGETYSSKLVPNEDVLTPDEVKEWNETSQDAIYEAQKELDKKYRSGVPDAPFEKNWQEVAMKRMMRYATENGFDKLAWTKGEQQAKRYALSNTVETIHAEDSLSEMEDGTEIKKEIAITTTQDSIIRLYVDANGNVLSGEFKGKHLSEIVGKDVASRLMADGEVTLEPMDLEIGGEGMKGFYDKMLPSFINKYGKKWGVKVSEVTLPYVEEAGRTMHSIDITDTMKEQLDAEAQPMFRVLANPAALVNAPKPNEIGHENETFMEYLQRYEQWRNDKIAYENYTESEIPQFPSWDKDRMTFKQYLDAINDYKRGVEKLDLVSAYNQAFFTKWKEFKEAMKTLVDTGHRIRAFYKWMKSQGADIDPRDNAYNDSHRRNSRMQHVLRVFEQNQKLNMMNAMNAILRSGKLDGLGFTWQNIDSDTTPAKERRNGTPLTRQEILSVYAQAKDCKEAKELGLPDRGENAFKNNLGMSYQDVIDAVEGAVDPRMIYNLWDAIKAVNDFALDYQLKYGMIDQATRDSLNRKYYVPERGWKVRDMDGKIDGYMPSKNGSKYSSFNPALVKAHGRSSLASDPFPYMLSIVHSSVVATEKNRTLQALYRGLMKNERLGRETGAYKIRRIWGMIAKDEDGNTIYDREGKPITLISYEAPTAEMYKHDKEIDEQVKELRKENSKLRDEYVKATPARQAEINQEVSDNNAKIKRLEESKYMTVMIEDTTIKYRTKNETQQHIIKLKVDGADVEIEFKDEKLANAINGGNWVSNMNDGWMKDAISRISKLTQKLSSWKTQYNYEFAVSNFTRDLILSHMINGIREGEVFALKASKEVFASMGTIASYLTNGKNLDKMKDSKRKQYLQEFLENGALTGFSFTKPIEDISEELYKELMRLDGDNRTTQEKMARLTHLFAEKGENALAFLSELSEMSVRFAQYVTCRDAGKTIEASATSAKEITTNFDRKSQLGNAFGWVYGFFNAAIQGTMNIAYAVKDNPKRGAAMLSAWSAIFVGLGYAMASLFAPDDPEDETYLTEWDRWTNLTIPLPGKNTIVIPLPHVMRAFNALGVNMAMVEKGRKPLNQAVGDVVQFFLDELTPSSPLQIQNAWDYNDKVGKWEMDFVKYAQGAMPTSIQPIMDTILDRNFMNAPIAKRVWNDNIADIHRANNHTEQFFIDFAHWLNKISGGDPNMETKYKGLDINPSNMKHILTGYGGGLPQLIIDTGMLIYNTAKGNDIQTGEIPFLRKVVRTYDNKKAYTSEYWDLKNKVDNYKATLKDAKKNSKDTYRELKDSNMYDAYKKAEKILKKVDKPKKVENPSAKDISDMIWANQIMNKGEIIDRE